MDNCDFCFKTFDHSENSLEIKKIAVCSLEENAIKFSRIILDLFHGKVAEQMNKTCGDCVEFITQFYTFKENIHSRLIADQVISSDDLTSPDSHDDEEFEEDTVIVTIENLKPHFLHNNYDFSQIPESNLLISKIESIAKLEEDVNENGKNPIIFETPPVLVEKEKENQQVEKNSDEENTLSNGRRRSMRTCNKRKCVRDSSSSDESTIKIVSEEQKPLKNPKSEKKSKKYMRTRVKKEAIIIKDEDKIKLELETRKNAFVHQIISNQQQSDLPNICPIINESSVNAVLKKNLSKKLTPAEMRLFNEKYEQSIKTTPMTCCYCNKILATKFSIKYHIFSRHMKPKETAQKMWVSQKVSEGKITQDLNVIWKCSICNRICNSHPSLRYHLNLHREQMKTELENEI